MKWPSWLYRLVPYLGRHQARRICRRSYGYTSSWSASGNVTAACRKPMPCAPRNASWATGRSSASVRATSGAGAGSTTWGRMFRHAFRSLRRSPGFATTVVLVLALGIGANTAMFSIVYGMLIRPLPYPEADAIVRVAT